MLNNTFPCEDFKFPAIKLNKVVLPDPLGPIIPVIEPLLISNEQLETAARPPKNFETFFMIEHDMEFISRLCDPVIVMAEGSILFEGTAEEAKKDEKVLDSYLGRGSKIKDEN